MASSYYREYEHIKQLSRKLRINQTASEVLLWEILRRKNLFGFKFLRQHPLFYREDKDRVEFYIADFYCSKLKLIIEVDGPIHDFQKEYDSERDTKLSNKWILVFRIDNEELADINLVINKIKKKLSRECCITLPPFPLPLKNKGKGLVLSCPEIG
jgi:very-short-patch-repair endonuclease